MYQVSVWFYTGGVERWSNQFWTKASGRGDGHLHRKNLPMLFPFVFVAMLKAMVFFDNFKPPPRKILCAGGQPIPLPSPGAEGGFRGFGLIFFSGVPHPQPHYQGNFFLKKEVFQVNVFF